MKWCIKITEENLPVVGKWFNENSQNGYYFFDENFYIESYFHYPFFRKKHIFTELNYMSFLKYHLY